LILTLANWPAAASRAPQRATNGSSAPTWHRTPSLFPTFLRSRLVQS